MKLVDTRDLKSLVARHAGSIPAPGTHLFRMIKTIVFDVDGVLIRGDRYFSQRFSDEFGIPMEKILPFFKNEFQSCLVGEADIKTELSKYTKEWGWTKSVDDLLAYWFAHESKTDEKLLEDIKKLRNNGIKCFLHTNNEKYRVEYLLETVGLNSYFDGAFSSAHIGYKKPQPEFWASVYARIGTPDKNEILVWDDDHENIESAKNFGFMAEVYSDFDSYENRLKTLLS